MADMEWRERGKANNGGYWRIDPVGDICSSLDTLAASLNRLANGKNGAWKWVILAAHNALQGALAHALSLNHFSFKYSDKDLKALLQWAAQESNQRGPMPEGEVASAGCLIRRAMSTEFMTFGDGGPLVLEASEKKLLKQFDEVRDGLTHFEPDGWSIEIELMNQAVAMAARATAFVMVGHAGVRRRLEPVQLQVVMKRLRAVSTELEARGLPALDLGQE